MGVWASLNINISQQSNFLKINKTSICCLEFALIAECFALVYKFAFACTPADCQSEIVKQLWRDQSDRDLTLAVQFNHLISNQTLCCGPPALHVLNASPDLIPIISCLTSLMKNLLCSWTRTDKHWIRGTWFQKNLSFSKFEMIMVCSVLLTGHHEFVKCETTS